MTFEWLGSLVATVAVTAVVTNAVNGRRNGNGNNATRVMLDKLDKVCNNLAALETLPSAMNQTVQLLGEIKGLLSR